jgi:hypothetical protein
MSFIILHVWWHGITFITSDAVAEGKSNSIKNIRFEVCMETKSNKVFLGCQLCHGVKRNHVLVTVTLSIMMSLI